MTFKEFISLWDTPTINPWPKLRLWLMRCGYALLLHVPPLMMIHYYPPAKTWEEVTISIGDVAALILVCIHLWFCITYIMVFWYFQRWWDFKIDAWKKKKGMIK